MHAGSCACPLTGLRARTRAQVQVVYTSSNGYADSWGKLYPFYVNKLCQLQDKVEEKLGALHG